MTTFQRCAWPAGLLIVLAPVAAAHAQPASLNISIAVRETGNNVNIGGDGGTNGGMEWLDLDAQTLVLDGTWQQFSVHIPTATVTPFAGATANGILEGTVGVLEHIRFKSTGTTAGPIAIWIDDLFDHIQPAGLPNPAAILVQDWEAFAPPQMVTFQEPYFSGTTLTHLHPRPSVAVVDTVISHGGDKSYRIEFEFVDDSPERWLRLTTFDTDNQPNPCIYFDQNSTITFWLRGCVCTPSCPADFVTSKTFQPPPDGVVDGADLAVLLGAWGESASPPDIVSSDTFQPPPDGVVDGADLAFLLGEWGRCE